MKKQPPKKVLPKLTRTQRILREQCKLVVSWLK